MADCTDTSITEDVLAIQRLAEELKKARSDRWDGTCDDCGGRLYYDSGHPGSDDEPPSDSGFYCSECDEWTLTRSWRSR
jgi:hypothetical protein